MNAIPSSAVPRRDDDLDEGLAPPDAASTSPPDTRAATVAPDLASTRPLRIQMIAPTPFFADRGCHVRILEEVRILEKLGHQVQVVTYHHGRDLPGIDIVRSVTVPWYRKLAPGPSVHKLYTDWLLVGAALHAAEHFRPHLVHGHLHEGIFVGEFLRRRYRIPLVADLQGSLADEVADHTSDRVKHLGGRMFERAERWLTSLPDCIVTSSSRFAEIVREQFGRDDVVTLADAVDTERFRPLPRSGELASAMGIPDDRQIVVFLGVLTGYQGVEHLLEAARKILKHRRKLQFLIMGYPSVESYRERAADLGIADHITFPGRIDYDRACEYLNLGDIAVSAKLSRTEANGKLFNYMACGLPVVAYDSPINREILADLGCYAEYGDTDSLAFQIDALLDDHQRRRDLAAHLRARVVEHFSWNRAGLELANLYDALLARRREQKAASQVSG